LLCERNQEKNTRWLGAPQLIFCLTNRHWVRIKCHFLL
jgi:hypothetical protein